MGGNILLGLHCCFCIRCRLISTLKMDSLFKMSQKCACMLGGGKRGKIADPGIPGIPWVLGDVQYAEFIVIHQNIALELRDQIQAPAPPVNSIVISGGLLPMFGSFNLPVYKTGIWATYPTGLLWALSENVTGIFLAHWPLVRPIVMVGTSKIHSVVTAVLWPVGTLLKQKNEQFCHLV